MEKLIDKENCIEKLNYQLHIVYSKIIKFLNEYYNFE